MFTETFTAINNSNTSFTETSNTRAFANTRLNAIGFVSSNINIVDASTIIVSHVWNSLQDYKNFLSNTENSYLLTQSNLDRIEYYNQFGATVTISYSSN